MKMLKKIAKWATLALLALIAIFVILWAINSPEKLVDGSESLARLQQTDYQLDSMRLSFEDTTRATPALGKFKGADSRTLKGTIWFPKGNSTGHPLLVFSHGFGSYHKGSRHIAKHLTRKGYIVAAVDFPLSNLRSPAGTPQLLDIANQPGDVSAVIDQLLKFNNDSAHSLYQRIDSQQIGAYGLSLGGLTTALVSFHPDYQDKRIKAAVMLAPPLEAFSDNFFAANSDVASLLISGTLDRVVPEQANAVEVQARHPKGWFLSLDKGSHLGFANVGNPIRWMTNPDDLGCVFMDSVLTKLELPDRWSEVLPNTQNVLQDIVVPPPCPDLPGEAMNGLKQQWFTRIATEAFFDMHLRSSKRAENAGTFFTTALLSENKEVSLRAPR